MKEEQQLLHTVVNTLYSICEKVVAVSNGTLDVIIVNKVPAWNVAIYSSGLASAKVIMLLLNEQHIAVLGAF